jgi:hypothetical protein
MPAYDSQNYDPPAPLASVILLNPDTGANAAEVPMLLDSGADVSLVPQAIVEQLGVAALPGVVYEVVGFDGLPRAAQAVRLSLVFCGRTFSGQFLLLDQARGILGRNILNTMPLLFDGPNLTWDTQPTG